MDPTGPGVDASEALAGKLRTLIQLIELISSSLDTDEILRQLAAAAVRLTDARCVSGSPTRRADGRAPRARTRDQRDTRTRGRYGQGVAGWVTLNDEPFKAGV